MFPLDAETLGFGPMNDERLTGRLVLTGFVHQIHQSTEQRPQAFAGGRRHALAVPLQLGDLGLGPDHDPGPLQQVGLVVAEFVEQRFLLIRRLPALGGLQVDEHEQHAGALDVAQERMTQALAFARAFDQPGDVGDHHLATVDTHDAEIGLEGREGIVGDLGTRRRSPR